jgi:hypothetical protein
MACRGYWGLPVVCRVFRVVGHGWMVPCRGCAVLCRGFPVACRGWPVACRECREWPVACRGFPVVYRVFLVVCREWKVPCHGCPFPFPCRGWMAVCRGFHQPGVLKGSPCLGPVPCARDGSMDQLSGRRRREPGLGLLWCRVFLWLPARCGGWLQEGWGVCFRDDRGDPLQVLPVFLQAGQAQRVHLRERLFPGRRAFLRRVPGRRTAPAPRMAGRVWRKRRG